MAGHTINISATLQCPHGGTVSISSANVRAKADNTSIATQPDVSTVSGCPFFTGSNPSPCLMVVWSVADVRAKAGNIPTLSKSATGSCIGPAGVQGNVIVANTQSKSQSQ